MNELSEAFEVWLDDYLHKYEGHKSSGQMAYEIAEYVSAHPPQSKPQLVHQKDPDSTKPEEAFCVVCGNPWPCKYAPQSEPQGLRDKLSDILLDEGVPFYDAGLASKAAPVSQSIGPEWKECCTECGGSGWVPKAAPVAKTRRWKCKRHGPIGVPAMHMDRGPLCPHCMEPVEEVSEGGEG